MATLYPGYFARLALMNTDIPDNWLYRYLREPVNSITHFVGILLSIAGLIALLVLSEGDPWRVTSFAIYGASLIVLYTASTLLHSLKVRPKIERRLRIFDHAAIFGLIAGTYTPVTLITLQYDHAAWGWTLLSVAWALRCWVSSSKSCGWTRPAFSRPGFTC